MKFRLLIFLAISALFVVTACGKKSSTRVGQESGTITVTIPGSGTYESDYPNANSVEIIDPQNAGSVTLSWLNPQGGKEQPVAIEIWRSDTNTIVVQSPDDGYQTVLNAQKIYDSEDVQTQTYTDSNLDDGKDYYYLLRYKYPGNEHYVYSTGIIIRARTIAFNNPINFQAIPDDEKVILTWQNYTGDGTVYNPVPNRYEIYRQEEPFINGDISQAELIAQGSGNTSYTDAARTNDTTYYYLIRYFYETYNKKSSGVEKSATPYLIQVDPIQPGSVQYGGLNGSVIISWTNPQNMEGKVVRIFRHTHEIQYDSYGFPTNAAQIAETSQESVQIDNTDTNQLYYYAVLVYRQESGRYSPAQNFTWRSYQTTPASQITAQQSTNDAIKLQCVRPEGALRVEVYYSSTSPESSFKGSGQVLRGPSDNWDGSMFMHNAPEEGNNYYSLYAVYQKNSDGEVEYAPLRQEGPAIAVYHDLSEYELVITQSSSVPPEACATPNTYNWDQTITITPQAALPPDVEIRYTLDGSEPDDTSAEYTVPFTLAGSDTGVSYHVRAAVFFMGIPGQVYEKEYTINYRAYDDRFKVVLKKNGNSVNEWNGQTGIYASSGDLEAYVEYTPGCGETFSLFKAVTSADTTTNAGLGESQTFINSMTQPASIANRLDAIAEAVVTNTTGPVSIKVQDIVGRDYAGGKATRIKLRLDIVGRPVTSDPSSGDNPDLVEGSNVQSARGYIIYPKLHMKSIDMWNRPAVTPYLWTRYEPVVKVEVEQVDFFTGETTPANNVNCYFRVQYAEQNKPYRQTTRTLYWVGTLQDPDFTEGPELQAITSVPRNIINPDPFTSGPRWGDDGNGIFKQIAASDGVAYYQIDNPYDTYRIGQQGHYEEVDNSNHTGELKNKAFRTCVRFRVTAGNMPKFRNADNVLKSFESNTVSNFDTYISPDHMDATNWNNRRFSYGTTSFPSDMPAGYRSYPIEVCEEYEGWSTKGHQSQVNNLQSWYTRHGVTWYGPGQSGSWSEPGISMNKNFDTNRRRVVVFAHGWEMRGGYELFLRRNQGFNSEGLYDPTKPYNTAEDYESWLDMYSGGMEWEADRWIALGYNVGFYHWHKYAQEKREVVGVPVPGEAEVRIMYPTSENRMAMYSDATGPDHSYADAIADVVRSASIGMMAAQAFLDSLPEGYEPELVVFVGHSLGNQVMINAIEKLIRAYNAGLIPLSLVPDRLDLLDPYWGQNGWSDGSGFITGDRKKYLGGETTRVYATRLHTFNGDDYDGDGPEDAPGIPVQWYRTTALTQAVWGQANDNNTAMLKLTNYVKLYFVMDDLSYVPNGSPFPRMSSELHAEAVRWYFRSIERNIDDADDIPVGTTNQTLLLTISARSKTGALWNRLNTIRNTSDWRWYQMFRGKQTVNGQTYANNKTIDTIDDVYNIQESTSGTGYNKPEM